MSDTDDSEKEFDPTPQKLEQARKRGELVRSNEITVAATYTGLLIAFLGMSGFSVSRFGGTAAQIIEQAGPLSEQVFKGGSAVIGPLLARFAVAVLPWLLVPAALVLVSLMAQRAIVFAGSKLEPKLSRINPIANAKQKFGRSGLFEFVKSFVKLAIISVFLGTFLVRKSGVVLATQRQEAAQVIAVLGQLVVQFLALVMLVAVVFGAIDYLWQYFEFMRRNRMTRKELMDEMKQSEGDPHLKQQRRQKGIEIATKQMLQDVAEADVVIVNPTHYAVALKWSRASGRAPICVAKGVDEIARRIREIAMESGVPIHSDPPTARALFAAIDVGDEIRPEHYKPVAAAIRFAEKLRKAAKKRL